MKMCQKLNVELKMYYIQGVPFDIMKLIYVSGKTGSTLDLKIFSLDLEYLKTGMYTFFWRIARIL